MKILLIGEFSGLQAELKRGLTQLGHNVTLAAATDFYKKYPSDINLGYGDSIYTYKFRQLIYPFLNLKKFTGFDIVHIVNFYTIPRLAFLNLIFIKFLKQHNGIVTLSGAGDDPFFVSYSTETMRYSPIAPYEQVDCGGKPHYMRRKWHLNAMHECLELVHYVIPIVYEYYSTFVHVGYKEKTSKPIPIPIDISNYKKSFEIGKKLIFFHGLTRPGFKGTSLIKKSFEKLTENYPNDVECIVDGKMSFSKYIEILARTNISVDQVFSYSLGMNALFSMAQGKIVCGGVETESSILYDGQLPPAINLKPDANEIYDSLVSVLDRRAMLGDISDSSRAFVEKYHNSLAVAQRYVDVWQSTTRTADVTP
jgi:glycosyltransferase involved in cell wall biosynthesis